MYKVAHALNFIVPLFLAGVAVDRLFNNPSFLDRFVVFCLSWPIARAIRLNLEERELARRAASLGGVLPPSVPSFLPFGLSVFLRRFRMIRFGSTADSVDLFKISTTDSSKSDHSRSVISHKVVRVRTLGVHTVWTMHYEDAKYLLSTKFENFGKSPSFKAGFKRLLGEGVFVSDQRGLWAWHRSLSRPHFAKDRVADVAAMEAHALRATSWLEAQSDKGNSVEIQDLFARYTLTLGTQQFLGKCLDCLNDLIQDRSQDVEANSGRFAENFIKAQNWAMVKSFLPPIFSSLGIFLKDQATTDVLKMVDKLIQDDPSMSVNKYQKPNDDAVEKEGKTVTLLDHLMASGCSKELVRHECLNILLAARDTTSSLLTSCIYELARESSRKAGIWKKLKEEVDRLGSGSDGMLTLAQINDMKYLRATLNETLRLHPPVWVNARHAFDDDVLPSGFFIPAGADCRYLIREFHRNPELWGKDAEEFDPERWLDDRKAFLAKDPHIFQPFGLGPRICLGQQFAYTEASIMMIRIIERFDSADLHASEGSVAGEVPGIVAFYRDGVRVRMKKREV